MNSTDVGVTVVEDSSDDETESYILTPEFIVLSSDTEDEEDQDNGESFTFNNLESDLLNDNENLEFDDDIFCRIFNSVYTWSYLRKILY